MLQNAATQALIAQILEVDRRAAEEPKAEQAPHPKATLAKPKPKPKPQPQAQHPQSPPPPPLVARKGAAALDLGHANCPPPWPTFAPFYTQKEQCKKLPFFERVFSRPMKLGVQKTLSTLLLHDD